MNARNVMHRIGLALALLGPALLVACGGSSPGATVTPPDTTPTTLSGVAALGATLAGASVSVIDTSAATADPAPITTAADGSYSVDITGLQGPFTIQVLGTADGVSQNLISVLLSVNPNSANTANVTPLTNAVAALIAPGGNPLALLTPATLASAATITNVTNAVALLRNTLATDVAIASVLGADFNPMTTSFSANGTGIAAVLEQLSISIGTQGVSIVNLSAPVGAQAVPAPVVLSAANVLNPTSVPQLPASAAAGDLPSAADIEGFRAKLQACMALPWAQRVAFDVTGAVPTALSVTCDFADAGYRSNGRNWVEDMGRLDTTQFNFSRRQFNNAGFGKGTLALALAPQTLANSSIEFKHPQCNQGPCAAVRYPVTSPSGYTDNWDLMLGKVAGQWAIVGNKLPYDVWLQAALNRYIAANTAPNPSNQYFFKNRFESTLTLTFNASGRNGNLVRAIRLKGPGLPAAGLVYHRSMRCGTDYRFPLTNQTGSLRNPANNSVILFADTSGATFVLDAANLDGTALALQAGNFGHSPTPIANQASTIPAWSRFAAEVFLFSNTATPDSPDEVVYFRIDGSAMNASEGANRAWPNLAQTFVDAYLTATGSGAGVVSGGVTMGWADPAGVTVLGSYLFRQDAQTQTNVNGVTASYTKRGFLAFEPDSYGNTSAPSTSLRSILSGASLVPETANAAPNPNPRCTDPSLVPVTSSVVSYYEAGLSFRGPARQALSANWFWDN